MKKILLILYCAAILIPCAFFSFGMLIPGASEAAEGDVTMPVFATAPSLSAINDDFGNEFEEYFSKSFAYRNHLVDAFSLMKTEIFREGNDQVIVGREDFLYFAETLADYTGENPMTDGEIEAAADALAAIEAYAESHAAKFLFASAPNKNTIYPEYMPARYPMRGGESDLDRLHAALDARGVAYLDLRPVLTAAKSDGLIYHKRDTHWNTEGARLAWEAIGDALSLSLPDYGTSAAVDDFRGDLDTLLFPKREMFDANTEYPLADEYIFTSAYKTPMDMTITTRGSGSGRLLMFRDSFANALIPFAASAFAEAQLERAVPYRADLLETEAADVVIVQIAERNLRTLIDADQRIR